MGRAVLGLVTTILRALWATLVIVAPALGVWVASSLAAYRNGPVWLVCVAGLLLFPIVPVGWDLLATARRRRRARREARRVLTTLDRLVLRTLVVNLLFLGGLLWARPEAAFTAISTRGDWFLDGMSGARVEQVRGGLLRAADGLQWLYEAAHDNQFAELIEAQPTEAPAPQATDDAWRDLWDRLPTPDSDAQQVAPTPAPKVEPAAALVWPVWPSLAVVHPAVVAMPDAARVSIQTVGEHLRLAEPDPARRIKAIHDFVATHLVYDVDVLLKRDHYPDQRAEAVFAAKVGVCAGYANLTRALAEVTGDEVVVVVGDSRGGSGAVDGVPHAWNAARIDGRWYLLDATWDSGHIKDGASWPSTARTTCSCRRR